MSARRVLVLWRRARHAGRDLDLAGYAAFAAGAVMLIATGIVGPTLDARSTPPALAAAPHSAHAASAAHAPN